MSSIQIQFIIEPSYGKLLHVYLIQNGDSCSNLCYTSVEIVSRTLKSIMFSYIYI